MLTLINPVKRAEPFDHADWVFEAKFDGFRAAADTVRGRLISRNGNRTQRFERVLDLLPKGHVFDGELVVLDHAGRPLFNGLLFGRRSPTYVAFDLLIADGMICGRCRSSNARPGLRGSANTPKAGLRSPTASSAKGGHYSEPWSMLTLRA
jgi:ATP-dependent DNA ligase